MMRRLSVGIAIFAVVLACSGAPYPQTSDGMWEFIHDAQENWIYEPDQPNEPCQAPAISLLSMRGDCDDFAVMIAYCLQEYWGYDTFTCRVQFKGEDEVHRVAFLWVTEKILDEIAECCNGDYPYLTVDDRIYIPIDWQLCPTWRWVSPGTATLERLEWYEVVGKPY